MCRDFRWVRLCSFEGRPGSGRKRRAGDGVWFEGMSRPLTSTGFIWKDGWDTADRRAAVDSPQASSKSQRGGRSAG